MATGFRGKVTLDKDTVASGGSVVCTLGYEYRVIKGGPPPDVLISCSPAFSITCVPKPLRVEPSMNGTLKVTVTITHKAKVKAPPELCRIIFNGLADERQASVTVTP